MYHPREVSKVSFSPDDRSALTIASDGSARLWDIATSQLLARPLQYEIGLNQDSLDVVDGIFSADGTSIRFQCADGTTRRYEVPQQLPDDPKFIRTWTNARSAFQLDGNGIPRPLSQAEWLNAQRELLQLQKLH
jgi:WD40 repeat protein